MTKGNDGTGNTVDRDDWETPKNMWDQLNHQYKFTFDCCASKITTKVYQYSNNFESIKWENLELGVAWMNPPFSNAKNMFYHFFKIVKRGVAIYRCDNMETELWQFLLKHFDWVHILQGRTNYKGHEGKGARFGSALVGIGVEPPKDINGVTLKKY